MREDLKGMNLFILKNMVIVGQLDAQQHYVGHRSKLGFVLSNHAGKISYTESPFQEFDREFNC